MKDYDRTVVSMFYPGSTFYYGGSGSKQDYEDGVLTVPVREYYHGSDNPYWRIQVEKNEQAATPLVARREECECSFSQTLVNYTSGGAKATTSRHALLPASPNTASWSSSLVDKAEADAWTNLAKAIRKTQSSYDGLVFAGELGQTASMLRNPLKSINDAVGKILADRRFRNALKASQNKRKAKNPNYKPKSDASSGSLTGNPLVNGKTAAELLLQWNFGIMPLWNDLQGMVKAFSKAPLSGATRVRGYGEAEDESISDSDGYVAGVIPCNGTAMVRQRVQVVYTAGVLEEIIAPEAYNRLRERGNLDLSNLPAAAYELIPWSFLLDYFSNVGDVLSAVFTSRRSVRWIVRSEIRHWEVNKIHTPLAASKYTIAVAGYASCTTKVRTTVRTLVPVDVVKFPPVYWELPKYARQYVNMAALARLLLNR